jgi:hypothetical protein
MHIMQLDIPDELAEKLAPYSDHLLGVQKKARRVNLQTMTCAIRVACDCICWLSVLASTVGNSLGATLCTRAVLGDEEITMLGRICLAQY